MHQHSTSETRPFVFNNNKNNFFLKFVQKNRYQRPSLLIFQIQYPLHCSCIVANNSIPLISSDMNPSVDCIIAPQRSCNFQQTKAKLIIIGASDPDSVPATNSRLLNSNPSIG